MRVFSIPITFIENPAAKQQEPQSMTRNRNQENSAIEGHNGKHHHIGQTHSQRVQQCLNQTGGDMTRSRFNQPAMREPLDQNGEHEDDDQRQKIHAGASGSRPVSEENGCFVAPIEAHVHHHLLMTHPSGSGSIVHHGRRRWRTHVVHMAVIHVHINWVEFG